VTLHLETAGTIETGDDAAPSASGLQLPSHIFRYIWRVSGPHQVALCLISIAVFLLGMAPLELQRRIVNGAFERREMAPIAWLCAAYVGVAMLAGGLKLALNIYRGWVSEGAVRDLRHLVYKHAMASHEAQHDDPREEGVELSVILAEAEPVGGFIGLSISEPLLQAGILVTVFGYMVVLQPWMALVSFVLFAPQLVFVPLLQHRINTRARKRISVLRDIGGDLVEDWTNGDIGRRKGVFERRIHRVFGLNMRIYQLKFTMNFLMNLLHHLGVVGVLLIGGWLFIQDRIEVGTVVAFISGLARVNEPWGDLVNYFREVTVAQVKYGLVVSVFEGAAPSAAALAEAEAPPRLAP